MNLIKNILKFLFTKSNTDCCACVYGTSTGHGWPCCECDGEKYFELKGEQ